eukprot:6040213-Pyramimonas_sp.AAC.1
MRGRRSRDFSSLDPRAVWPRGRRSGSGACRAPPPDRAQPGGRSDDQRELVRKIYNVGGGKVNDCRRGCG